MGNTYFLLEIYLGFDKIIGAYKKYKLEVWEWRLFVKVTKLPQLKMKKCLKAFQHKENTLL